MLIRSVFSYLDRSYLLAAREYPQLNDMGIRQFREAVFRSPELKQAALQGMCNLVEQERTDKRDSPDASLIRDSVRMLHVLGNYMKHFHPAFLSASQKYLDMWADVQSSRLELAGYVKACTDLIQ